MTKPLLSLSYDKTLTEKWVFCCSNRAISVGCTENWIPSKFRQFSYILYCKTRSGEWFGWRRKASMHHLKQKLSWKFWTFKAQRLFLSHGGDGMYLSPASGLYLCTDTVKRTTRFMTKPEARWLKASNCVSKSATSSLRSICWPWVTVCGWLQKNAVVSVTTPSTSRSKSAAALKWTRIELKQKTHTSRLNSHILPTYADVNRLVLSRYLKVPLVTAEYKLGN